MNKEELSLDEAYEKVCAYLENGPYADRMGQMVVSKDPDEYDFGWVFYYDDKRYPDTGDDTDALLGNAPVIVDRFSGELVMTGTARSTDFYVENYRETGNPSETPPSRLIRYTREFAVQLTREIDKSEPLPLAAKKYLPKLVDCLGKNLHCLRTAKNDEQLYLLITEELLEAWLESVTRLESDGTIPFDQSLLLGVDELHNPERWTPELFDAMELAIDEVKFAVDELIENSENVTRIAAVSPDYIENRTETDRRATISAAEVRTGIDHLISSLPGLTGEHEITDFELNGYLTSLLSTQYQHLYYLRALITDAEKAPRLTREMNDLWLVLQWETSNLEFSIDTSRLMGFDQCLHPEEWTPELLNEVEAGLEPLKLAVNDILSDGQPKS